MFLVTATDSHSLWLQEMKTEYAKFHTDYKESFFFSHRDFVVRNEIHLGPDPDWTPPIECHYSILFYSDQTCSTFICFYFSTVLLFYSVLFSFALFSFTLYCALYSILFYSILACYALFHSTLLFPTIFLSVLCTILLYNFYLLFSVLSCVILFYFISLCFVVLLLYSYCSLFLCYILFFFFECYNFIIRYSIVLCSILIWYTLFCSDPICSTLFCYIQSFYTALFYSILSVPDTQKKYTNTQIFFSFNFFYIIKLQRAESHNTFAQYFRFFCSTPPHYVVNQAASVTIWILVVLMSVLINTFNKLDEHSSSFNQKLVSWSPRVGLLCKMPLTLKSVVGLYIALYVL